MRKINVMRLVYKFEEAITPVFNHAREIGKSGSKEALPFLTTLAAILYVISLTLGSGSYKDIMVFTSYPIEIMLFAISFFVTLVFGVSLLSYLDSLLGFSPSWDNEEISKDSLFKVKWASIACFAMALPAAALVVYNLIDGDFNRKISDYHFKYLIIYSFLSFIIFICIVLLGNFLSDPNLLFYAVSMVISFCVGVVFINTYREAQKLALVNDSQFCYWYSAKLENLEASEETLYFRIDYDLCRKLRDDKGIEFDYIRSRVVH